MARKPIEQLSPTYSKRIQSAIRRGKSYAEARGHHYDVHKVHLDTQKKIDDAYVLMREKGYSATRAAKESHVGRERLTEALKISKRIRIPEGKKRYAPWTTPGRMRKGGIESSVIIWKDGQTKLENVICNYNDTVTIGKWWHAVGLALKYDSPRPLFDMGHPKIHDIVNDEDYDIVMDMDTIDDILAVTDDTLLIISDKPMYA